MPLTSSVKNLSKVKTLYKSNKDEKKMSERIPSVLFFFARSNCYQEHMDIIYRNVFFSYTYGHLYIISILIL
jgi:hypothetical protein